ncbi:hypothetical protein NRB20_13260 [Nocardia sp. RB20]|uniref:Uncharacterized protein n=1 Tax=Nocardia macrotermitis TaxID=2585198 RepID=A0A7K0CXN9_9NOCA|nr:hypothetical protein [Nocardia macrotermitis]
MSFPSIGEAIRNLSQWGVTVLAEDAPHEPRSGNAAREQFPWKRAWHTLLEHLRLELTR